MNRNNSVLKLITLALLLLIIGEIYIIYSNSSQFNEMITQSNTSVNFKIPDGNCFKNINDNDLSFQNKKIKTGLVSSVKAEIKIKGTIAQIDNGPIYDEETQTNYIFRIIVRNNLGEYPIGLENKSVKVNVFENNNLKKDIGLQNLKVGDITEITKYTFFDSKICGYDLYKLKIIKYIK